MSILDLLTDEDEELEKANQINGVVVGIVTNNKDPDGMGRIKVTFPTLSDDDESFWARMSTLMAGKDRGSFFLPEVEDEVLVAFGHGDIDDPYIIGALWNGVDTPPETNSDGKNNIRKIKSRSGHEIILNDEKQKEKLEIHTNKGHTITLDDSAGAEKISIIDKTEKNLIEIDSVQNSIKIESTMKLNIKSKMVEIESDGMMTLKAGATLTLQGALIKIN
ncbi:MAG: phage tail protein [Candidatus Methanomarinus sp.]|uniref:Phage tail protein n=1 Tax=Candidatus Methanomarinus sp. TaxID=3386244 RepID=A0AC61SCM1_9EURY|nr:MAG: putative conserved protein, implicated in type VI secretion and phage assembly [ANME-2 cluster archaeon]KAF5424727.1 putative conserved protein, implicated in type VI secretion and phage assembly [ANME-2 cluster archaeon]TKY92461.1 MAG: phage tail protein [ANME-2 cluster archaeon]